MGYNSVLFICNDALGEIDRDPAGWWERARYELMKRASYWREGPRDFGHGMHCNGFPAVWNAHADVRGFLIVGRNEAKVMGEQPLTDSEIGELRYLLEKQGLTISKKRTKK